MLTTLHLLFRSSTWRGVWIAIRRSGRDTHARRVLLRFGLLLLAFTGWVWVEWYQFRGLLRFDPIFFLIFFGVIVFVFVGLTVISRISERRELAQLEADEPSVSPEIKKALYRETFVLACLLIRFASERGMEKELPPTIEVITRRSLIERLRTRGLLKEMLPSVRNLLLAPDGHWTEQQKVQVERLWEIFEVLAHVLGLTDLSSLSQQASYSLSAAYKVLEVRKPESLGVLPSWDLRPARDVTEQIFGRCWIEIVARGEWAEGNEEVVKEAMDWREHIQSGGYTEDVMVGVQTVSEISSATLWLLTRRTLRRLQALRIAVEIVSGEKQVDALRELVEEALPVSTSEPDTV